MLLFSIKAFVVLDMFNTFKKITGSATGYLDPNTRGIYLIIIKRIITKISKNEKPASSVNERNEYATIEGSRCVLYANAKETK